MKIDSGTKVEHTLLQKRERSSPITCVYITDASVLNEFMSRFGQFNFDNFHLTPRDGVILENNPVSNPPPPVEHTCILNVVFFQQQHRDQAMIVQDKNCVAVTVTKLSDRKQEEFAEKFKLLFHRI